MAGSQGPLAMGPVGPVVNRKKKAPLSRRSWRGW